MFGLNFDYASCIANSEKVAWKLDEVMPVGTQLDFSRPFLPEQLVMLKSVTCLSDEEKKKLNQIVGNAYLNLFGFVEEYILATIVQHAKLDALELQKLAVMANTEEIEQAVEEYLQILGAFDGLLKQQAEMDVASLAVVTKRTFSQQEHEQMMNALMSSYRKTFITYGMTNPGFVKIMGFMSKHGQSRIADQVAAFN
jgi:hypothetical protein